MKEKYTSLFENGLIWFGAAVSLAEILTGTYFAPLGFFQGPAGHPRGPCHRLPHAVLRRCHRRQCAQKCHGNGENELWQQGWPAVLRAEHCPAGGLDRHHDLRRGAGSRRLSLPQANGSGACSSAVSSLCGSSLALKIWEKINTVSHGGAAHPYGHL